MRVEAQHEFLGALRAAPASPAGETQRDAAVGIGPMVSEAAAERDRALSAVQPSPSACDGVPNVHSTAPSGRPARASMKSRAADSSGVLRHAVNVE